jgi:hypothetical protein
MQSAIHVSALVLALGACLGLVTAQHDAAAVDHTVGVGFGTVSVVPVEIVDDYDRETEATATINVAAAPQLELSDEQRALIFFGVINLPDIPELAVRAPATGVPLASTVELHNIPAMVAHRIPEMDGYKFVKLVDRILLVSTETRQVESSIPRYKLVFH